MEENITRIPTIKQSQRKHFADRNLSMEYDWVNIDWNMFKLSLNMISDDIFMIFS